MHSKNEIKTFNHKRAPCGNSLEVKFASTQTRHCIFWLRALHIFTYLIHFFLIQKERIRFYEKKIQWRKIAMVGCPVIWHVSFTYPSLMLSLVTLPTFSRDSVPSASLGCLHACRTLGLKATL
jgi:hypothetical protein